MKLQRLSSEASSLVSPALASGSLLRYEQTEYERFLEPAGMDLHLAAFNRVIDDVIASTPRHDPVIDLAVAPALHRALPLSRREAAHDGVWRFLAVIHRPDFIRHRWDDRSWLTTRTRYWSAGTRPDSNAFCRLWWIAELTRDAASYSLTERVFSRHAFATQLFVRSFSQFRPAIDALVDVLADDSPATIERVAKELSGALSTLVLESLDPAELRSLVRRLRDTPSHGRAYASHRDRTSR